LNRHGGNENEARAIFESYNTKRYEPDARFEFTLWINELQKSGIVFEKNDLTIDQWFYLTWFKDSVNSYIMKQTKK